MSKQVKDLTVILSCYGADKLIDGYVDSILGNNYLNQLEVMIVNIVTSHQNPNYVESQIRRLGKHVTLINLEHNITLYEAWNLGVQRSKTEFVSNLNLDDRVTPDYYEVGVRELRKRQADVFSSNSITTSQIGNWNHASRKDFHLPESQFGDKSVISYSVSDMVYFDNELNIKKNSIPHCCPIWRRSLHEKYGYFDCQRFDFCADFAFWLKAAAGGAHLIHHRDFLTLFYMGSGTVSDRLIHADNKRIVDRWTPAFESMQRKESELGYGHDLLHFAFNHEVVFSNRGFHSHLINRISVCTIGHSVDVYFIKAIQSVIKQSYQNFELVIVLDGIKDSQQQEMIQAATNNDLRIKFIVAQEKLERSNCRNIAISAAVGEWVMLLDSDDMLHKDSLKHLLRASQNNPQKVWFGNEVLIDDNDQRIEDINYGKSFDLELIKYSWPSHANILWPAFLVRGARYPAHYIDPDLSAEQLAGEDVEFMVCVLKDNPSLVFENCGEQTYYWRRHLSSSYRRRHVSIFSLLSRLIRLFPDHLPEDKFSTKLAERFFDCFIWFSIDAVARGGLDYQFLAAYTQILRSESMTRVVEKLCAQGTDHRIRNTIDKFFLVNKSILASIDPSMVENVACSEFRKFKAELATNQNIFLTALAVNETKMHQPSIKISAKKTMGPNYQRVSRFRNYHKGQECILMCNGPSLRKIDFKRIDRDRYVLFGLNKIFLAEDFLGEMPRYLAAVNAKVIEQSAIEYEKMKTIKFLSNRYFAPDLTEDPHTYFINTKYNPVPEPRFSFDVGAFVNEGWTVTHVALQIIYHMGFKTVYLVGLDHRFTLGVEGKENTEGIVEGEDPDHFHPKYFGGGQKWDLPDLVNSEISYRAALDAFTNAGRSIVNCTPGTACDIFPIESHERLYR